jgi:hypothetical protein
VTDFTKCNFTPMHNYITAEKDKKKAWTKDQKKAEKERVMAEEEKLVLAILAFRTW